MLEINISEGKPNRFKQAANILVGSATADWLVLLANLEGEVEVDKSLYSQIEADIAAVGGKDWLRAYGVGEEAAKLRLQDVLNTEITGKIPPMRTTKYSSEHPDGIELKAEQGVSEVADKTPALGSKWRSKGNGSGFTVCKSCAPEPSGIVVVAIHDATGLAYEFALEHWLEQFELSKDCAPKGNFFQTSGNTNYPKAETPDDKISGKHKELLDELLGLSKIAHESFKDILCNVDDRCNPKLGSVWRQMYSKQFFKVVGITATNVECAVLGKDENVFFPFEQFRALIPASTPAHPLQEVFDAVIAQVTTGKGQRHGGGEQPFYEQPWFTTTQQVGIGFPLGQAMKKLGESSSKPDAESFETELLGAIAYAAMAYLANKKIAGKS